MALVYLNNRSQAKYDDLSSQLAQEETADQKALESSVLGYRQRLQDFSKVLNAHTSASRFFTALETLTYATVYFNDLIINPLDKTATISGKTDSFENLAKQVAIFKNATTVFNNASLSKINVAADGKITFTVVVAIKPDAILYK